MDGTRTVNPLRGKTREGCPADHRPALPAADKAAAKAEKSRNSLAGRVYDRHSYSILAVKVDEAIRWALSVAEVELPVTSLSIPLRPH